jgi:hypothetical protein
MRLMIELLEDAKHADGARIPIGRVTCPNCHIGMRSGVMRPVKESVLREVSYRCPRCDAETKRWVKP